MGRRLCHRYGPGRIPYASRRDIGGGISMAATGLLGATLWFGGAWLLIVTGRSAETLEFFFGVGLLFVPLSLLTAFLVGAFLWRNLYSRERARRHGALFGGITAVSSLAAGSFGPAAFLAGANLVGGEMGVLEAFVFGTLLVPVGFLLAIVAAGWLIIPLGVFGGWYHERAKTAA